MMERVETVIVGGGQAGLSTSQQLSALGREHLVLERAARAGQAWRSRWDSFTLVTPNWATRLPGAEYDGPDPDGFMARDEIAAHLEAYAGRFQLPVRYNTTVTRIEPGLAETGYVVQTDHGVLEARNVVIATGLFQRPRRPTVGQEWPEDIVQLHSSQYRNPQALPEGAGLVIGTAQSGCQIADELRRAGRRVYLSTSSAGRVPRRYRGRDCYAWLELTGFLSRTPDQLPASRARFAGNPHVSGFGGGRTLNLHQFARDGTVLLGRLEGAQGAKVRFAADLHENLRRADQFEANLTSMIDAYIDRQGLGAPEERLPELRDGFAAPEVTELDLRSAGIGTVIWATGYGFDFDLVRWAEFDADGYPVQTRGVSSSPGLYFVGLPWLHTQKSGLLIGVGEDAAHIAAQISKARSVG